MSRLDVQRKMMLLKLYESYWLMLPYELQEYILVYKINQEVNEERKKERSVMLCDEIVKRHQLKEAWGLGPIRCRIIKCKQCTEDALGILGFRLCGVYTDLSNVKKVVFLGYNIPAALQRVNHVKSFL